MTALFVNRKRLGSLFALSLFAMPGELLAQSFTGTINVEILPTITITEIQQIDFGVLLNEVGVCNMDATGFTSGDIFSCTGNETEGRFVVTGQTGTTLNLTATPGTANSITFTPTLPNGSTVALTGGGSISSAQVVVAGSIAVAAGASDGVTQIPFTLRADYN